MSDGAAAAVVMSAERARTKNRATSEIPSLRNRRLPAEEMGVGPAYAIPKALKLAGLGSRIST